MTIELLIADRHEVVRLGLRRMLEGTDIHVVAESDTVESTLRQAVVHCPHVVLLDVHLRDGCGLECLASLRERLPESAIIVFAAHNSPDHLARALAMGAAGYLGKCAARAEILDAIRTAQSGQTLWSRDDLRQLRRPYSVPSAGDKIDPPLTIRESDVLKQLSFGLTNKEIAKALGISYETVKEHVQHILKKLRVADRTQAAVWAVRNDRS